MAIQVERWVSDIIENLFPDDSFALKALDRTEYVVNGAVVHVPRAGARPNTFVNPTIPMAAPIEQTDIDIVYDLPEIATDPSLVRQRDLYELSYNKRMAVLDNHIKTIRRRAHNRIIHAWVSPQLQTTARYNIVTPVAPTLSALPAAQLSGTTGPTLAGRNTVSYADLLRLKSHFDSSDVPLENRFLLATPKLMNQIFSLPEVQTQMAQLAGIYSLNQTPFTQKGVFGNVCGFWLMQRSWLPRYTAAGALIAESTVTGAETAIAPTDRESIVAWDASSVSRAVGRVDVMIQEKSPQYLGDILNVAVKAGGHRERQEGVAVLYEA